MGWNSGYTIFEATVMGAYKLGVLDKRLLRVLMEPYAGTDIDAGGSCDIKVRGKGVEQVVVETMGGKWPTPPKLPRHRDDWTDEDHEADMDYGDKVYEAFRKVTRKFGW